MFTEFRDVNVGTLKAFEFDYDDEFNPQSLKDKAMSDELVIEIMKLGTLYNTRIQSLPEKSKRCTIFSPSERDATWDAFTAGQISNADGSETMESYAKAFETVSAQRLAEIQAVGQETLKQLFPDGSAELTVKQREEVIERLRHETRAPR